MRRFLWRQDPPSSKDWSAQPTLLQARARQPSLPTSVRWDVQIPDILDQGGLGSCVANAVAYAIRAGLIRQGASGIIASRLFLYYMARAADGNIDCDCGTYLRSALDGARRVGYPSERFWPYDDGDERFRQRPEAAAIRAAYDQINNFSYRRVTSVGPQLSFDLRTLLAEGRVVMFGTKVSDRFRDYGPGSAPLDPPGPAEPILGGHALLLAGYGTGYFEVVNSWGAAWGRCGWCRMTDAYIENWRSADFWILDNVRPFSEA